MFLGTTEGFKREKGNDTNKQKKRVTKDTKYMS